MKRVDLLLGIGLLLGSTTVEAQAPGRLEAAIGVRWIAATSLGASEASATRATGGRLTLFTTESQLDPVKSVEGRLGVRIAREIQIEASASYGESGVTTSIGADVEGIPDSVAAESLKEFTVEGAVVWQLERLRFGSRVVPLVSAGGGYMRRLHEDRTLAETGGIYHVGVGVSVLLAQRTGGRLRAVGLRADGRGVVRTGGVVFDDRRRVTPAAGASLFVRF